DEAVGVLDAGPAQEVRLHAVADDEVAPEAVVEDAARRRPAERGGIAVHDGHVVTVLVELLREPGPDPAAAHDEDLHLKDTKVSVSTGSALCVSPSARDRPDPVFRPGGMRRRRPQRPG